MRAVFFGTPEIAVKALEALDDIVDVVSVVCQPDRPAGRGMTLKPPAVKVAAARLGIDVVQPDRVKGRAFRTWVQEQNADVCVVMAYGRILPKRLLGVPRLGFVNLHASLLPKYRGAAPIQWAIAEGEAETGISLMQMDPGMDTGDVLSRWRIAIRENETSEDLALRLADLSAHVVRDDLPKLMRGELTPEPQQHDLATYARILRKQDGAVDWSKTAAQVHDWIRAMTPWPGAFSLLGNKRVKIHDARLLESSSRAQPGTVMAADKDGVVVACGQGTVSLLRLQLPGKKALDAEQFLCGRALHVGDRFSPPTDARASKR